MGPGSLLLYMPETSSLFGSCHLKTTETSAETLTILCKLTLKFMLSSWRKASAYWSFKTDSERTNGQTVNELTEKKKKLPTMHYLGYAGQNDEAQPGTVESVFI